MSADDHVKSITEQPFLRTQVGDVSILISLKSSPAAHSQVPSPAIGARTPPQDGFSIQITSYYIAVAHRAYSRAEFV